MAASAPLVPTVGEISRRLGAPQHRIEYIVRSRDIRPVSRAGNIRVFDESAVQFIASELRRIDQEREGIS